MQSRLFLELVWAINSTETRLDSGISQDFGAAPTMQVDAHRFPEFESVGSEYGEYDVERTSAPTVRGVSAILTGHIDPVRCLTSEGIMKTVAIGSQRAWVRS